MKKVICTIMAMLALTTSAAATENVKTFKDIGRDMVMAQIQRKDVTTDTSKQTTYDHYWYVFGLETLHTQSCFYKW